MGDLDLEGTLYIREIAAMRPDDLRDDAVISELDGAGGLIGQIGSGSVDMIGNAQRPYLVSSTSVPDRLFGNVASMRTGTIWRIMPSGA